MSPMTDKSAVEAVRLERQTFKDAAAINVENDRLREALHDLLTRPTDGAARQRARTVLASPSPPPSAGVDAVAVKALVEQAKGEAAWALNKWKSTAFTPELVEAIFTSPAMKKLLAALTPAPTPVELPAIPDDDADFTPDLARKIIAGYQQLLRANSTPVEAGGEAVAEAWRWTCKGDSQPFMRLSGTPLMVAGDVIAVKPLYALAKPAPAVEAVREAVVAAVERDFGYTISQYADQIADTVVAALAPAAQADDTTIAWLAQELGCENNASTVFREALKLAKGAQDGMVAQERER